MLDLLTLGDRLTRGLICKKVFWVQPALLLARLYMEYAVCIGVLGGLRPRRRIVIKASVSIYVDLSTCPRLTGLLVDTVS